MVTHLLKSLVKHMRKVVHSLGHEPPDTKDEHVFEHLLLYHGLVGSSPENQRSFKDVRADVLLSGENASPLQMGIALKVPPLWWDDKLKKIFTEAKERFGTERLAQALLYEKDDQEWPTRSDPLGHPDWRVRANAASMLAFLDIKAGVPRIVRSLNLASSGETQAAFCHLAYALGKLGTEEAHQALSPYLYHEEPWFRVDAAGALANWSLSAIAAELMQCLLQYHPLQDYASVAVARRHKPAELLSLDGTTDGVSALCLGLLDACRQTFPPDVVLEAELVSCFPRLSQECLAAPTPLRVRAVLSLADWMREHESLLDHEGRALLSGDNIADIEARLKGPEVTERVLSTISDRANSSSDANNLRQAIKLAGELHLSAAAPLLLELVRERHALLDDAVDALYTIGDVQSAPDLIDLVNAKVELGQRTGLPPSRVPILEADPASAKTYWLTLRALGNIPSPASIPLLLRAAEDYAPDQREQALDSLTSVYLQTEPESHSHKGAIIKTVEKAMNDPASQVKCAALRGVSRLKEVSLIPEVIKISEALEVSVSRQAFQTLADLWKEGHSETITTAINARLKASSEPFASQKLTQFLSAQK